MMSCSEKREAESVPVFIDHDGGVDDLLSQVLLSTMAHVELLGVNVLPGDCYVAPALESSAKLLTLVGKANVPLGEGSNEGVHPFPDQWRAEPEKVLTLDLMRSIPKSERLHHPAADLLWRVLAQHGKKVTLLVTGPMGNVAEAIVRYPELKKHIKEIVWMGGAFHVNGNVVQNGHSGVAEWNVYCDPISANLVLQSGIPMVFIPLDVTDQVPVSEDFLMHLRKQKNTLSQLAVLFWEQTIEATTGTADTYYMWDVLATSYLSIPEAFILAKAKITIVEYGKDSGQTKTDDDGVEVSFAKAVDKALFYDLLLKQFSRSCSLD